MRLWWAVLAFSFSGCVPLIQYREIEKDRSAAHAERNELSKRLAVCEERTSTLKERLRVKPTKVPVDTIDQKELDAIKKKALEDAERKFKARTGGQVKP